METTDSPYPVATLQRVRALVDECSELTDQSETWREKLVQLILDKAAFDEMSPVSTAIIILVMLRGAEEAMLHGTEEGEDDGNDE